MINSNRKNFLLVDLIRSEGILVAGIVVLVILFSRELTRSTQL